MIQITDEEARMMAIRRAGRAKREGYAEALYDEGYSYEEIAKKMRIWEEKYMKHSFANESQVRSLLDRYVKNGQKS